MSDDSESTPPVETFNDYLSGLAERNGDLMPTVAKDAPMLASLPTADRMRLFARLTELGVPASALEELRGEMETAKRKKTNAAKTPKPGPKKSQATLTFELGLKELDLFMAPSGESYATIPFHEHHETHPLRSNALRNYLAHLLYAHNGELPGSQAKQDAISLLEYHASATVRPVYTRIAEHDGKIYVDLANAKWEAVEVDADGWKIVSRPPVAFRRPKGMGELPYPERGGDVELLRPFVNIEQEDWPLLVAWTLAAYWPTGPYPAPILTGEQGSTKTTLSKVLKELVDPSTAKVRGQPGDVRDLMIAAHNSWLLVYDNISSLPHDVSDALCRIATGGGYTKRANYTDSEEILIDVQRPIILNGIGDFVTRPDLMDRAIAFNVPSMAESNRKDEKTFWREFYAARPAILGAFMDALSWTLGALPHVQLAKLPRMADFAKLAVAAEPTLGLEPGQFMARYAANRSEGAVSVLDDAPIVPALRKLVIVSGKWEGNSADLLDALEKHASERTTKSKLWPDTPKRLTGVLKRLAPVLRQLRIVNAVHRHGMTGSRWSIERLENCVEA